MPRKYEQTRRAAQQQETRRRIVEAAVALHGTDGPARTTMSAIAERAGVQRNTLYRHFPDERSILDACSSHFDAEHPMPSPEAWTGIDDPAERLRHGLGELYAHWAETEEMTARVLRDAELDPVVNDVVACRVAPRLAEIRSTLLAAWPQRRRTPALEAAVDLAVSFRTWQTLVRGRGLTPSAAAGLMAGMVICAA